MTDISFMMVLHPRLPNEGKDWNHVILYASDNDFKTCRQITTYSDLFFDDELEEFKKRMDCVVITEAEFKKRWKKDDWNTTRRGEYKRVQRRGKK